MLAITPSSISNFFIAIFFLFIVSYFSYHLYFLFSPPYLFVESPNSDIMVSSDSLLVSGNTYYEDQVFINNKEIVVDSKGDFHDQLTLKEGLNVIEVKSVNRFDRETKITRRIFKNN